MLNEWDEEEIGSTILIEDYLLPFILNITYNTLNFLKHLLL